MSCGVPLGRHLLADLHGVAAARLADGELIEAALIAAARAAGATPLFTKLHRFGAQMGVTGVVLLQESHISIHTWPEHGFAAVDVFMCGDCRPERAVAYLAESLAPQRIDVCEQPRGDDIARATPHAIKSAGYG